MFKNDFQGGNYFEIFNPTVKDPLNNFKLTGPHGIQKIYDKEIKGSVYQLDGVPTTTKISLPKDSRQGLSLIQRFLVFQVNIKQNQDFSMEIGITDLSNIRRNLLFSTSHKEVSVQPLSARIPLKNINRSQWTNFVFDLTSLINDIWKNQTFKSIDSLAICANCKLRKIFTLKNSPSADFGLMIDDSLITVDFPQGIDSKLQLFSITDGKSSENTDQPSTSAQNSENQKNKNVFKIAFGSKIPNTPSFGSSNLTSRTTIKSANSHGHIDSSAESCNISLKNNGITPLSMSNNNLSSTELTSRRKSESDNHLADKSNFQENSTKNLSTMNQQTALQSQENRPNTKTSWNQRATNKSASNKINQSNKQSTADPESQLKISEQLNGASNDMNVNNKLDSVIQTTKIPHPPPQSTRPTSSSIRPASRKIRLTSAVKNSSINSQNNNNISQNGKSNSVTTINSNLNSPNKSTTSKPNNLQMNGGGGYGGESSNEEDINNNSSKTIFDSSLNSINFPVNNQTNHFLSKITDSISTNKIVTPKPSNLPARSKNNSNNFSSQEESNIFNESITDLIQVLKGNNQPSNTNVNSSNFSRPAQTSIQGSSMNAPNNNYFSPSQTKIPDLNLDDSASRIVYSFSSKPKPVSLVNNNQIDRISNNTLTSNINVSNVNNTARTYDFRKYSTNPSNNSIVNNSTANLNNNQLKQSKQLNSNYLTSSRLTNKSNQMSILNDSLNEIDSKQSVNISNITDNQINPVTSTIVSNLLLPSNNNEYNADSYKTGDEENQLYNNDLMDSFEARMLQEMKAEMESKTSKQTSNSSQNTNTNHNVNNTNQPSDNQQKRTSKNTNPMNGKNAKLKGEVDDFDGLPKPAQKSPDADYIETLQREASGIQSPMSDDNHTTSEKYNFDAVTSSIDETTTSISKKASNRGRKLDESNNYQDEMNVSLQSNLPAKSINFKDLPLKYSPLNHHIYGSSKFQKSPITEEPPHYDDSQADIDEINSDSDEEVDLLYDPALNCYYDPKTATYYELNLS